MDPQTHYFDKLVELMDILRGPGGCPWDREQTRETLKPMLIEEAYEVLEALDSPASDELCEELGDLLFQVVFHSRIAKERGDFDAYDVCRRVYEKMVNRHPHVFGDRTIETSEELLRNWEEIKAQEKQAVGKTYERESLLDGIPEDLPSMYRAYQMTAKAARVGFDWPQLSGLRDKFLEEFHELEEAVAQGDGERIREEVGDLVFVALNVARYLEVDPETALRGANRKFKSRFQGMERVLKSEGHSLKDVDLEEMERVWQAQKGSQGEPVSTPASSVSGDASTGGE
ncbi:MAG: nucleoside triphosphate pyrophosphohydrolase [Acidobacteriota bacterium]